MKNLTHSVLLWSLIFVSIACKNQDAGDVATEETKNPIHRLKAMEFYEISTESPSILLDVRTLTEFNQAKLPNAILIDINKTDFEQRIQQLPKNEAIYVYCTVGARSMQAAKILQKNGFEKIYHLEGGIMDWARHQLPISKE
jgi:rhodanese-related sulfurtransferase